MDADHAELDELVANEPVDDVREGTEEPEDEVDEEPGYTDDDPDLVEVAFDMFLPSVRGRCERMSSRVWEQVRPLLSHLRQPFQEPVPFSAS